MLKNTLKITILSLALFASCSTQKKSVEAIAEKRKVSKKITEVNFPFDSTKIKKADLDKLNNVISTVYNAPDYLILRVKGHTDKIGTKGYNYELGKQRARSVKNALVSRGIDDKNIKTISYGEEKPAVSTNIWDKRAENRRAVVEIIQVKNLNDDSQKDIHLYPQNYLP